MDNRQIVLLSEGNASLIYCPGYFETTLFQDLKSSIPWQQRQLTMFGKTHDEPRLTAWFGPSYSYSGVEQKAAEFPVLVEQLRQQLSSAFHFPFNGVLLNYYRDGADYMGWHRDNEKTMDQRCIASASFGAERKFVLRSILSKEKTEIILENGSLLLMNNLQHRWQHSLPKSKSTQGERINLTFRHILTEIPGRALT